MLSLGPKFGGNKKNIGLSQGFYELLKGCSRFS